MERVGPLSAHLASFSFLLWMLPLTDSQATSWALSPPAPRLFLLPLQRPVTRGQQVSLHCSPPEGQRPEGFVYYKKGADDGWTEHNTRGQSIVKVSTIHLEQKETFACAYWEVSRAGERSQSEQSNQVELSVLEPPATLSLHPQHPVYIQGERVTLYCKVPDGLEVTGYAFYKVRRGQSPEKLPSQPMGPYARFLVEDKTAGEYSCEYQVRLSGRETQASQQSNLVSVAVIGRPPSPDFSITPKYSVYKTGESINLTCSVPGNHVSGSLFFKDGRLVHHLTAPSFTYTLCLLPQHGGSYSCRYQLKEATRDISSLDSSSISLKVMGPLRPPDFFVSPKKDVYRSGESISLECSVPQHHPSLKILFFKDKQQLLPNSSPASEDTFTHSLHLSPLDSGKYFCRYQFVESGRQNHSPRSSFFKVSVMASPSATVPKFSTSFQAAQSNQTAMGLDSSARAPTAPAWWSTSPHMGAEASTPTRASAPLVTSNSAGLWSSPSHDPVNLTTHPTKLHKETDSSLDSSKPTWHDSSPKSATSQDILRSSNSSDPRGTSQSVSEHSEGLPLHLLLAIGCGGGGAFVFLALLTCLYWRKQKDRSKISARAYWKSLKFQQSEQMGRCKDPVGMAITLQERDTRELTWPASQDWGLLPKSKILTSNLGDRLKVKKRGEDANSRAELEFPEIDPTYMLLGFSCSTFRQEENNAPKEEPHIYNELFL